MFQFQVIKYDFVKRRIWNFQFHTYMARICAFFRSWFNSYGVFKILFICSRATTISYRFRFTKWNMAISRGWWEYKLLNNKEVSFVLFSLLTLAFRCAHPAHFFYFWDFENKHAVEVWSLYIPEVQFLIRRNTRRPLKARLWRFFDVFPFAIKTSIKSFFPNTPSRIDKKKNQTWSTQRESFESVISSDYSDLSDV